MTLHFDDETLLPPCCGDLFFQSNSCRLGALRRGLQATAYYTFLLSDILEIGDFVSINFELRQSYSLGSLPREGTTTISAYLLG